MTSLFVGGISQETKEEDLNSYFQSFGTIATSVIVYDKVTRSLLSPDASKGYAFVTCENPRAIQRILEVKSHQIQGRLVEVTEAVGRQALSTSDKYGKGSRRLFVGGIIPETTRGSFF